MTLWPFLDMKQQICFISTCFTCGMPCKRSEDDFYRRSRVRSAIWTGSGLGARIEMGSCKKDTLLLVAMVAYVSHHVCGTGSLGKHGNASRPGNGCTQLRHNIWCVPSTTGTKNMPTSHVHLCVFALLILGLQRPTVSKHGIQL